MDQDAYPNYAALAAARFEGRDYRVTVVARQPIARVAVAAPHAGGIEYRTSEIATAVAGDDYSLYLFEGIMQDGNGVLHITSHRFDEPRCLNLLRAHDVVVTIHGCGNLGGLADVIYMGGLDARKERIAGALRKSGFDVCTTGHRFAGTERGNICNRGASGQGVQIELSRGLRKALDVPRFAAAVRAALLP